MKTNRMNINELISELTKVKEENERRGWSERNELPMIVSIDQGRTPSGKIRNKKYAKLEKVNSCRIGGIMEENGSCLMIEAGEAFKFGEGSIED